TAGPVTERLRGRDARLAGIDATREFGGEEAQIEEIGLDLPGLERLLGDPREAIRLRHLARARAVVARGAADDKHARGCSRITLALLRGLQAVARLEPLDGKIEVGIGEARPCLGGARRLAVLDVAVPRDRFQPTARLLLLLEGRLDDRALEAA